MGVWVGRGGGEGLIAFSPYTQHQSFFVCVFTAADFVYFSWFWDVYYVSQSSLIARKRFGHFVSHDLCL